MKQGKTIMVTDDLVKEYLARPYSRVIIPQDDGRFSAEMLEFPGCFTEGDTVAHAYANLEDAAAGWIAACLSNGMKIPDPSVFYTTINRRRVGLLQTLKRFLEL